VSRFEDCWSLRFAGVSQVELRARLKVLREELEAGRLHFAKDMKVLDSLKLVRYGPDGKVDLSTVDGGVRALANVATHFRQRREATAAVPLRDLQESFLLTSKQISVGSTLR
jgi:hypothetical protein